MTQPLTTGDIEAAERVLGVTYSASERQQMLDNLEGQIASAVLRRAAPLDNGVPMASRFDPRLPGFGMPPATGTRFSTPASTALPTSDEDIAFAPITQLSAWLGAGALTSRRLRSSRRTALCGRNATPWPSSAMALRPSAMSVSYTRSRWMAVSDCFSIRSTTRPR